MSTKILVISFFALFFFSTGKAQDSEADKYLLPWNLRPEHYSLTIFTHIEQFNLTNEDSFVFMGINNITVGVFYGDVSEIVFHRHRDIQIENVYVFNADTGVEIQNVTIGNFDFETEKQIVNVEPPLENNGRYLISIWYIGKHSEDLDGFYRSFYDNENNELRWLVLTNFESFGARRAFPCFDEPEYKATYQVVVHINQTLAEQGYRAFSNTDAEKEEIIDGKYVTTFKITPRPISTYLVAFVVSDFSTSPEIAFFNSSYNGENGTKAYRTIGRSEYISKGFDTWSQIAGPAALNIMTQHTQVGYGFEKSDQIGIPYFGGAMENWGLCTYAEDLLFSSEVDQLVVQVIVHELSHQWFGDLVTLHWWSDLWLNEGFATFFEYQVTSEIREDGLDTEDWDMIGQQIAGSIQYALFLDSFEETAGSLTYETYNPSVIGSLFNSISYDKGGAVIRMWSHVLGNEIFYNGLNRYLKFREESIGTPEILLGSWEGAVDDSQQENRFPATISNLFKDWHLQAGYPVVTVRRDGNQLILTQTRFFEESLSEPDNSTWNIPVTYSTNLELNFNDTSPVTFMLKEASSTTLNLTQAGAEWVVLNNQATSYYRIDYDDDNWDALLKSIDNPLSLIPPYNKAQILDDFAALQQAGKKNIRTLLKFLFTLRHERAYTPWKASIKHLQFILAQFDKDIELSTSLKNFVKIITQPILEMEQVKYTDKLLKEEIAEWVCNLDFAWCQNFVVRDLKTIAWCQEMKSKEFTVDLLSETLNSLKVSERKNLIKSIACNINLLSDVLKSGMMKGHNFKTLILHASSNGPETAAIIYKYLSENKNVLSSMHQRDVGKILVNLVNNLDASAIHQTEYYIDKNFDKVINRNIKWKNSVRRDLINYFLYEHSYV